jgi:hypothetical protein
MGSMTFKSRRTGTDLRNVVTLPVVRVERYDNSGPWSRELVKAIAMDIGKAVVHHIETMYPAATKACPSTFKLSVRNCVHNEIMAALETTDEEMIRSRLAARKRHRREIKAAYKKIRE